MGGLDDEARAVIKGIIRDKQEGLLDSPQVARLREDAVQACRKRAGVTDDENRFVTPNPQLGAPKTQERATPGGGGGSLRASGSGGGAQRELFQVGFTLKHKNPDGSISDVIPVAKAPRGGKVASLCSKCDKAFDRPSGRATHEKFCQGKCPGWPLPLVAEAAGATQRTLFYTKRKVGDKAVPDHSPLIDTHVPPPMKRRPPASQAERKKGGTNRRFRYTVEQKSNVLSYYARCYHGDEAKLRRGITPKQQTCEKYGIPHGTLSAWTDKADLIHNNAADLIRKRLKIVRTGGKPRAHFPQLERKLQTIFLERRKRGARISRAWFQTRALLLFPELYPERDKIKFKASRGWVRRFCKRMNITRRRRTHTKKTDVSEKVPAVRRFHQGLVLMLSSHPRLCPRFGRFLPENRYNLDQVPLPFTGADANATYEICGAKMVWIRHPGQAMDKRTASIQICIRAETPPDMRPPGYVRPTQPNICLIFRGQGNAEAAESAAYHPDVDVLWQPKAWSDRPTHLKWLEGPWKRHCDADGEETERLLFMDNLDSQIYPENIAVAKRMNTLPWFLVKDGTELVQPIDQGFGREIKREMDTLTLEWLEDDDNLALWESGFSASDVRVMLTQWVGEAYRRVLQDDTVWKYFQRTGCLMTLDGSGDAGIKLQGVEEYSFDRPPVPDVPPELLPQDPAPVADDDQILARRMTEAEEDMRALREGENDDFDISTDDEDGVSDDDDDDYGGDDDEEVDAGGRDDDEALEYNDDELTGSEADRVEGPEYFEESEYEGDSEFSEPREGDGVQDNDEWDDDDNWDDDDARVDEREEEEEEEKPPQKRRRKQEGKHGPSEHDEVHDASGGGDGGNTANQHEARKRRGMRAVISDSEEDSDSDELMNSGLKHLAPSATTKKKKKITASAAAAAAAAATAATKHQHH
mmetsp:Transcript_35205/g.86357  ORF Transcript_35205/g.86357 Transcript_35205/m.86357 type:complete len:924 (-) Transcript_35205:243-3014(-)